MKPNLNRLVSKRNDHDFVDASDTVLTNANGDTVGVDTVTDVRTNGIMKIAWMSDWDAWGNGKGYTVHNNNMREQAVKHGAELSSIEDCEIALDVVIPPTYRPVPGKFNVLFTMYEMDQIPPNWIPYIQRADMLIVPCQHNKHIFAQHFDGPIEVCQEGFNPKDFPYVKRETPAADKHFNFLWVGASNPRKGYEFLCGAWDLWLNTQPQDVINKTRLIMKTTKAKEDESIKSMFNSIIDNRKLPFEELKAIYYAAHAFVLPSLGEGWGLTLHEAQASGLPCIYTPWSGPVDFMLPKSSYPLKFKIGGMAAIRIGTDGSRERQHIGNVAKPDVFHIVKRMEQVYYDYERATAKAKKAAAHLHEHFTWDDSGDVFMEILTRRYAEWKSKQKRSA